MKKLLAKAVFWGIIWVILALYSSVFYLPMGYGLGTIHAKDFIPGFAISTTILALAWSAKIIYE